jgi:hypothetical protein
LVAHFIVLIQDRAANSMSADRWQLHEQRRLAAEFMVIARLIADSNIRASILAPAQKWFDLAERGSCEPEHLDRAACIRDIQTKIGQVLRASYELPPSLPHEMATLLVQLNAPQDGESGPIVHSVPFGDRFDPP